MLRVRWKQLRDDARQEAMASPVEALELYTRALTEAPERARSVLLAERAALDERLGMTGPARVDLQEAIALLDADLAMGAQAPKIPAGLIDDLAFDAQLERWQRRAEANQAMGLDDEARRDLERALDHVDHQLRHGRRARRVCALLEQRALLHELMGMPVDADRDRLLGADALAAGAGDHAAGAALATAPFYVAQFGAVGLEFADALRVGWNSGLKAEAERERAALVKDGRAVGIGVCAKCRGVVHVTAGRRCPAGHKVDRARFVVPADVDATRAQLVSSTSGEQAAPGRTRRAHRRRRPTRAEEREVCR